MNNKKNIAIIPARSGSKGILDKNIKDLKGKPLMAYSIEAAIKSGMFDKVFVSTDSEKYAEIGQRYGADVSFLRSEEMSSDTASSWGVVREVIQRFEERGEYFERIMLLQPTSPLRDSMDIKAAFSIMEKKRANAVESVVEMEHSPLWSNTLPEDGCMDWFEKPEGDRPRQLLPQYYRLNGAIYLITRDELDREKMFSNRCYAYVMSAEHSIDIDTELDFKMAKLVLEENEQ